MYYQNNDDYMRDFFYFNQNPTMNNNVGCGCMQNNMNNNNYMNNNNNNLENLYPNIYRILQPVVRRVVAGNNYQYITEEVLNNMVDTVYNIVDGDRTINNGQVSTVRTETNSTTNSTADARRTVTTTNANNSNNSQNITMQTRNNEMNNNCNVLFKDLIKILILQEITKNNNMRRNYNNMNSSMMPNQWQQNWYGSMGYM